MTFIKICGITNIQDARCAAEAGADFLGYIFYPPSPRFVTAEQAMEITMAIQKEFGAQAPRFVGVFVDETVEAVRIIATVAGLDLLQLHGKESAAEIQALAPRAFKALRPQTMSEALSTVLTFRGVVANDETVPQFLIDAYHPQQPGGTGLTSDWEIAQNLARCFRLLLAGGLTPETVTAAITQVRPWGVDVSSGVEASKGIKDHTKMRAFINTVRAADAASLVKDNNE